MNLKQGVAGRLLAASASVKARLVFESVFIFSVVLYLSAAYVSSLDDARVLDQRRVAIDTARSAVARMQLNIDHALSATSALAALVRQGNGKVPDFNAVAQEMLRLYPGVGSIQLAPAGVVQEIVPLEGNQKAIGHNLLADPQRNKEAFLARDTGKLTLAGPFNLVQGGLGAAGRLPVFLREGPDRSTFWGFTIVLIRFPAILDQAGFVDLDRQGYRWALWRVQPDTGQRQVIAASDPQALPTPAELSMAVPNGSWTFSVAPTQGWGDAAYHHSSMFVAWVLSALLTLVFVLVRRYPVRLRAEVLARTRQLADERQRLSTLIESIPDPIFFKDGDGRLQIANHSAKNLLQLSALDWVGKTEQELAELHPDMRLVHEQSLKDDELAWMANGADIFASSVSDAQGSSRHFEIRKIPIFDATGARQALVTLGRDVTEHKRDEEALRIAATAFESQQGMFITDSHRVIVRVNKAFTQITGYSEQEAIGQTAHLLHSGRHDADFYAAMSHCLVNQGTWRGEIWNRRKDGNIYPEWLTISAVRGSEASISHYVAIFSDISDRVTAQAQIDSLAFYDPLTALPNRRLLMDRLDQALHASTRHARNCALLFVDLDNFKILNDSLGHFQGDLLLAQVAQRLKACISEGNTVARIGSDEFVVMLEDLSTDEIEAATQAETIGLKILDAFVKDFELDQVSHHASPSIGITLFGGGLGESTDQPLKRAELAMFTAKDAGRNTLRFFDAQMQTVVSARAALETELREAIIQEQFRLFYQPQVVGAGRLTGAEALLRWQHPFRGLVSPSEFIALAEESGLILPIGQWVLETACAQLALWSVQPETAGLTIAVNVSARQFRQPDFVSGVLATMAKHQVRPKLLKIELTESMLVHDVESVIGKMDALKAKGVGFSLDDFGTGYSSLSYLKRLPLDQLKIDQAFVRNIVTDTNDAAIAKMVVALAESLALAVIAEGVEMQAQADFLAHLGCHAYQGYLFSKPLPLDGFEAFVQAQAGAATA